MPADSCGSCQVVEECYEFMLAYAAQGLASETGNQSGAVLTDLFLVSDIVKQHIQSRCPAASAVAGLRNG